MKPLLEPVSLAKKFGLENLRLRRRSTVDFSVLASSLVDSVASDSTGPEILAVAVCSWIMDQSDRFLWERGGPGEVVFSPGIEEEELKSSNVFLEAFSSCEDIQSGPQGGSRPELQVRPTGELL